MANPSILEQLAQLACVFVGCFPFNIITFWVMYYIIGGFWEFTQAPPSEYPTAGDEELPQKRFHFNYSSFRPVLFLVFSIGLGISVLLLVNNFDPQISNLAGQLTLWGGAAYIIADALAHWKPK